MKRSKIVIATLTSSFIIGIAVFSVNYYDLGSYTKEDEFGIKALVVHTPPPMICPQTPCHFSGYMLKVNSRSHAFLTGYDICKGVFCTRQDGLSVSLDTAYPTDPFVYIIIANNVPWKVGDTVNIRVKVTPFNMAGNYIQNPAQTRLVNLGDSQVITD